MEFACEDGIPYAIDFMNPAPDADINSVGEDNFHWIVDAVAELAVRKAKEHTGKCRNTAGARSWRSTESSAKRLRSRKAVKAPKSATKG